ncbi:MAG: MATE family efflux transporter [Clostridia bacterium]|nr:MATE family efflux transporter [Clostridia bacterium]
MIRLFSDKAFNRRLWQLALPIALQELMLAAVAAGDAAMLGMVAQNEMAAVSLATQIQFVQNMIIYSIVSAGSILGAQYWGKGDRQTVRDVFSIMARICALVSLAFCAACELAPEALMRIFTNEPELVDIGAGYLRTAGWSYLLTGFIQCYLTLMKVTDHQRESALISSATVVLNLLLNAVFIFGLFGFPAMQARGAALATLIARIVEIVWAAAASAGKNHVRPDWKGLFRRDRQLSMDFARCGLPLLGAGLFWGIGFTSYTAIIGHMGADAAAAASVAAVVRDLICCLTNGMASGGGILVGNELGAGRLDTGKDYGIRLMKLSFLIGVLSTGLVLLSLPLTLSMMKLTDTARADLIGMMLVMSVYMIGRAANTVIINGIFSAGGDTLFDVYSLAVAMWGIAVPMALLGAFVFHWHPIAVYACTCLDEVGKIPWVLVHFRKYRWVKDLTHERRG